MSLMDELKTRLHVAVKNSEKAVRTSLRTVIGEAQNKALRPGVELDDALVAKVIKDTIKGNNDVLAHRERPDLVAENELLSGFLPKMMSDGEIKSAILGSGAKTMPEAMQFLSANHKGLFDGKNAKRIAMELTDRKSVV